MSEEKNTQPEDEKEVKAPEAVEETAKAVEETPAEAPAKEATEGAPADDAKDAPEATEEEATPAKAEVKELPYRNLKPGMVVRVHETIKDVNAKGEERSRVQVFEGTILGFSGAGITRTMTVRKVSNGFGVEKVYPLSSPHVGKVEVVRAQRTRRAKLWFLRKGFKRRLKEVKNA
ncbi:50S ribosomal protein L19 [Candidatus Uhrbacteria bacterium]|nr:50S ribosomal protein L19 [Candidatus Uhrbacteria bacterium]